MRHRLFIILILFLGTTVFSFPSREKGFALVPQSVFKSPISEVLRLLSRINDLEPPDPNHGGINFYISQNLPQEFRLTIADILKFPKVAAYDVDAWVIPIDGLFSNTGQIYHIGLGRTYGDAVIYVDEAFRENRRVLKHALYQISQWEGLRLELKIPPHLLRDWLKKNKLWIGIVAQKWQREADQHHPEVNAMIERLWEGISFPYVEGFMVPFSGQPDDLILGAGYQNLENSL